MLAAATIAEGVLGLEAEHGWNGVVLNRKNEFPRYNLHRINGLHARAESDDPRDMVKGGIGELPFPANPKGKTIVYTGTIEAASLPSLRTAINTLKAAFSDRRNEYWMTVAPPAGRGGVSWAYIGTVLACDVDDEQVRGMSAVYIHARTFSISIRQSDPRYYGAAVVAPGASGATVNVNNLGNAPSEPVFTLNGPLALGSPPRIERLAPDARFLQFQDSIAWSAINAGKVLTVEFGRSPRAYCPQLPGSDFASLLAFNSTWWDDGVFGILPGGQDIRVTNAGWSVTFNHASW